MLEVRLLLNSKHRRATMAGKGLGDEAVLRTLCAAVLVAVGDGVASCKQLVLPPAWK